jgi:L-fuconolactonase
MTKIIDSHVHLWNLDNGWNTWVHSEECSDLKKNILLSDFKDKCEGLVHVEAHDSSVDTNVELEWVKSQIANANTPLRAIAFANLTLDKDNFTKKINSIKQFDFAVGIRQILSHHPSAPYSPQKEDHSQNINISQNLAVLSENKFIYDCQMYPKQLLDSLQTIADFNGTVVIEHLGLPYFGDLSDKTLWQKAITELAKLKNTYIKISGLNMFNDQYTSKDITEVVGFCLDQFTDDRSLYASNYPVDHGNDYSRWIHALNGLCLSDLSKDKIFYKNSLEVYFKNII